MLNQPPLKTAYEEPQELSDLIPPNVTTLDFLKSYSTHEHLSFIVECVLNERCIENIDALLENPFFKDSIHSKQLYVLGPIDSKYALWIANNPELSCQVSHVTVLKWARTLQNRALIKAAMSQPHLISAMQADDLVYFTEKYPFKDCLEDLAFGLTYCYSSMPIHRKDFWLKLTFQKALYSTPHLYRFYQKNPYHFFSLLYQNKASELPTSMLIDFFSSNDSITLLDQKSLLILYTEFSELRRNILMIPHFCDEKKRIFYIKQDPHFTGEQLMSFARKALMSNPCQVDFADACLKSRICKSPESSGPALMQIISIRAYQQNIEQTLHWLAVALPILSEVETEEIIDILNRWITPSHGHWDNYQAILNKTKKDKSLDSDDLVTRLLGLDLGGHSNTHSALLTHYKERHKPQHRHSRSVDTSPNRERSSHPLI